MSVLTSTRVSGVDNMQDTGSERRGQKRRAVLWPAALKVGEHEFRCQIWNFSLGGARVRVDVPLRDGADTSLQLKGKRPIAGRVVWAGDKDVGIEFDLSPASVVERLGNSVTSLGLAPA